MADMPRLGRSIDWTGATGSPTWSFASVANSIYGSITLVSGMTISGTQVLSLRGRGTHSVTRSGVAFTNQLNFINNGGTCSLNDAKKATARIAGVYERLVKRGLTD